MEIAAFFYYQIRHELQDERKKEICTSKGAEARDREKKGINNAIARLYVLHEVDGIHFVCDFHRYRS